MTEKRQIDKDKRNSVILGIWVLIGALMLIITIYFVGAKKNLFSATFKITALFNDIQGLQKGNNIRFRGLDVGTVAELKVENDSSVKITMDIKTELKPYIKKNAIANIATDGLMGNKILIIQNQESPSASVAENDVLKTLPPIDMIKVYRKLNTTNDNIADITNELKMAARNMNNKNSLWSALSDTVLGKSIKAMDSSFVNDLGKTMKSIRSGSSKFNEDMEALKHNFLLRRYFKKKEKEKEKEKAQKK
jgi:phospholipid/cholesterol/gamma-HCH transport system substrate-binding protein